LVSVCSVLAWAFALGATGFGAELGEFIEASDISGSSVVCSCEWRLLEGWGGN
jgi:hypothetical protein